MDKKIWGVILIVIGVMGIFLPLVPGIVLIILGATLISYASVKRKIARMRKKKK